MLPNAVIKMTGVSGRAARSSPSSTVPSLPGIRMSDTTASKSDSSAAASASSAELAATVRMPSADRSELSISRIAGSSSTTRTWRFGVISISGRARPVPRREPRGAGFRCGSSPQMCHVATDPVRQPTFGIWAWRVHHSAGMDGAQLQTATVGRLMRRHFVKTEVTESLLEVDRIMRLARIRHLPVVENGLLVGILSHRDVSEAALSRFDGADGAKRMDHLRRVKVADVMQRKSPPRKRERPSATRRAACSGARSAASWSFATARAATRPSASSRRATCCGQRTRKTSRGLPTRPRAWKT